jgi:hypothetical protein
MWPHHPANNKLSSDLPACASRGAGRLFDLAQAASTGDDIPRLRGLHQDILELPEFIVCQIIWPPGGKRGQLNENRFHWELLYAYRV